jgi:hypothetical protein
MEKDKRGNIVSSRKRDDTFSNVKNLSNWKDAELLYPLNSKGKTV